MRGPPGRGGGQLSAEGSGIAPEPGLRARNGTQRPPAADGRNRPRPKPNAFGGSQRSAALRRHRDGGTGIRGSSAAAEGVVAGSHTRGRIRTNSAALTEGLPRFGGRTGAVPEGPAASPFSGPGTGGCRGDGPEWGRPKVGGGAQRHGLRRSGGDPSGGSARSGGDERSPPAERPPNGAGRPAALTRGGRVGALLGRGEAQLRAVGRQRSSGARAAVTGTRPSLHRLRDGEGRRRVGDAGGAGRSRPYLPGQGAAGGRGAAVEAEAGIGAAGGQRFGGGGRLDPRTFGGGPEGVGAQILLVDLHVGPALHCGGEEVEGGRGSGGPGCGEPGRGEGGSCGPVRCPPRHGSFFTRNSSSAIQPPPTRTIRVLRRMRTIRSCCDSPNCGDGRVSAAGTSGCTRVCVPESARHRGWMDGWQSRAAQRQGWRRRGVQQWGW